MRALASWNSGYAQISEHLRAIDPSSGLQTQSGPAVDHQRDLVADPARSSRAYLRDLLISLLISEISLTQSWRSLCSITKISSSGQ